MADSPAGRFRAAVLLNESKFKHRHFWGYGKLQALALECKLALSNAVITAELSRAKISRRQAERGMPPPGGLAMPRARRPKFVPRLGGAVNPDALRVPGERQPYTKAALGLAAKVFSGGVRRWGRPGQHGVRYLTVTRARARAQSTSTARPALLTPPQLPLKKCQ